jgi:hypothetical protein
MKSQTAKARNILYTKYNDGEYHRYTDYEADLVNAGMSQSFITRVRRDQKKSGQISYHPERCGWFVVRGNPNQLTLGDV